VTTSAGRCAPRTGSRRLDTGLSWSSFCIKTLIQNGVDDVRHAHNGIIGGPAWVQLIILAIVIGVPVLLIGGGLLLRLRAGQAAAQSAAPGAAQRARYLSQVRRCGLTGLLAGVLTGLVFISAGAAPVLAVLTCALGYLVGLLAGELVASPPERDPQRAASLLARRPADYAPRWATGLALASALLVVAAPIVFALVPPVRYPGGTATWPSPAISAAGAALAVTVLVLGRLALYRVATRPRATERQDPRVDEALRRQAGRAVAGAVLAAEFLLLGAALIASSDGPRRAATGSAAYTASTVLIWAGLACLAGGLASWLALSGWASRSRRARWLPPAPPAPAAPAAEQ
jgi:hypothetical protein